MKPAISITLNFVPFNEQKPGKELDLCPVMIYIPGADALELLTWVDVDDAFETVEGSVYIPEPENNVWWAALPDMQAEQFVTT